jgi:hypothetical protein
MKLSYILPLFVGSAAAYVFTSTSPAHALTTWNLNNAQFSDGSYVTGSFEYDETNNDPNAAAYGAVNVTLYSEFYRNTVSFSANDIIDGSSASYLKLVFGDYWLGIANSTGDYWYDAGSNVPFSAGSTYGVGNFGLNQGGFGTIGAVVPSVVAAVPFDIPGGATIPTLGSLLALGPMRKVRKNIALKTRLANPATETIS